MNRLLLCVVLFIAVKGFGQNKNNIVTGSTFVADPNFYKKILEKWNYQFTPPGPATKKEAVNALGNVTFWQIVPVKTDTGLWIPHISFDIYNKTDNEFVSKVSGKVHDNPNCHPEERGGEIYTLGNFLFVNNENCPDCLAYFTGANYCKSNLKLIFKNTKVDDKTSLPDLLAKLPVEKGTFK